jgi:hypothetical protein
MRFLYRFDHPGRKKINSEARAAPPAAPNQPVPFEARRNEPDGAAVVLTVTCPVPAAGLLITTDDWPEVGAHVGASTGFETEDEESAQLNVTVPV